MIIFDYATLADDSHRRHKWYNNNTQEWELSTPDYAAAKDDRPIEATIQIWGDQISLGAFGEHQIWCDIPDNYGDTIHKWLDKNLLCFAKHQLKMRPDGDTTPWHELKEKWLKEHMKWPELPSIPDDKIYRRNDLPEMAFEPSRSPMIPIWKKYGVTVMEVHNA